MAITVKSAMVSTVRLGHILRRGGGASLLKPSTCLQNVAVLPPPVLSGVYRLLSQANRGDRIGPDRVLPSNTLTTTWPDGPVEIRFSDMDPRCQEKPISVRGLSSSQNIKGLC